MTEVFGTDISPLRYLDHTDHVALWPPQCLPQFTSITATGDDWFCLTSIVRAKQTRCVHNHEDGMRKQMVIVLRCPPFTHIARMTKTQSAK